MTREERALQLWSLLALAATNRQVVTYELVARITGAAAVGLGDFLAAIQQYCIEEKLPPLTALVVNKQTALPGTGFSAAPDVAAAQLQVFEYAWTARDAPTSQRLADAYRRAS
jgi:hypothetical protein